ncbi:MAG TPA: hypothetical protein VMN78_11615 [Longimicrobiales bacterium]|nr:hypothetical protein [Longimicrobiales bacterium]
MARRLITLPETATGISPPIEGRWLPYSDGGLILHDLATDSLRSLTDRSAGHVIDSRASRGERQIAYARYSPDWSRLELRVVGVDGTADRRLYSVDVPENGPWISIDDWSPDGAHLLVRLRDVNWSWQLALLSTSDGSVRVLKSLGWRSPAHARFSPDGRYIAYDFAPEEESAKRDILLLAVDGSRETEVTSTAVHERLMGWAPDGGALFFVREERGSRSIWQVPVADGRRRGSERLVRPDVWSMRPIGFSGDRFFYEVRDQTADVYSAGLELESGGALGSPTRLFQAPGWFATAYSPDGGHMAYFLGGPDDGVAPISIFIRSVATGIERELEVPISYVWSMRWAPDGEALLVLAQNRGRNEAYRVDLQSRAATPLGYEGAVTAPIRSADGRTDYYGKRGRAIIPTLVARSVESGEERVLYADSAMSLFAELSPDEKNLLTTRTRTDGTEILLVPTAGGQPTSLIRGAPGDSLAVAGWATDGRHILFTRVDAGERSLWRLSTSGGRPEPLPLRGRELRRITYHPVSSRVSYAVFQPKIREVWVLEGLPPSEP